MGDRAKAGNTAFWGGMDDDDALQRYQTLVNTVDDGIYQLDPEGHFVAVNDVVVEMTGYSREELLEEHVSLVLDDADIESIEQELREHFSTADQDVATFELHIEAADGQRIPVELRANPLVDGGTFEGTVGVARDISDRKQRQKALKSTQESYESITSVLDEADVSVWILDDEFDVAWINEATERYFELDRDEVIGHDKRDLIDETIRNRIIDDDTFADTVLATYEDNTYTERFECRVTSDVDQQRRWLEHRSKPIESGQYAGGRVELYYDITSQKENEQALRESEQRFRSLVETVDEYAMFMLDTDGRVVSWNDGAERIKGYEADEIVGEHFSAFYTDEDVAAGVPEENLAAAREEGSINDEGRRMRANGSSFWANVTITAIRNDDGSLRGYAKVTRDMTERRERERQLQRERDVIDQILETSPIGIQVFDAEGELERMNRRAGEILNVPENQFDEYEPGDLPVYDEDGQPITVDEHPFVRALETGTPVYDHVLQVERPDGEQRWLSVNAAPILDDDGEVDRVITTDDDITDLKQRERELDRLTSELSAELDEVFERIDDAFYAVDNEFQFTHVNERAEELLQRPEEDLLGDNIWEEFPYIAEIDEVREAFQTAMESQEANTLEFYNDNLGFWVEANLYPSESGVSVYFADITERKEHERELELYETIVETVEDGVYAVDQDAQFVMVNDSFCEMTGWGREELLGRHATIIHDDGVTSRAEQLTTEVQQGKRERANINLDIITRDGERFPAESRVSPFSHDGNEGRCGVVRDISERKERERQLERRTRQQQAVAELGQLALESDDLDEVMHEAARQVADVLDNDYCKVLELDRDAEELLLRQGVGWREGIVGEATVSSIEDRSQAAVTLANEEPIVVQDLASDERISGAELPTSHDVCSGISTIIGSIDEPWGTLGTHDTARQEFTTEDVNFVKSVANVLAEAIERERYQNELEQLVDDLEESNERLEQFAYAASHDLQEPLRMVTSYLKLIEERYDDELDEDGREFLEFAVDGAQRMRDMIDALLEYSRVETQGDPFEPVDLGTVFDDTLENLRIRIEETNAEITTDSLPSVSGDRDQLRQVFQNLLSNAIEYSGDDPPRVHVSAERQGSKWRVAVRDEGIGVDPEHVDRIFEVFQRLHTQDEHSGTGIGLAMCQRIVERHGGAIWAESEPGEGSTFYFTLPAAEGSQH